MLHHLHELLLQCLEKSAVPQDIWDCSIVTLYKDKGDRSNCNNYRGISLLSIVGKDLRSCSTEQAPETCRENLFRVTVRLKVCALHD